MPIAKNRLTTGAEALPTQVHIYHKIICVGLGYCRVAIRQNFPWHVGDFSVASGKTA